MTVWFNGPSEKHLDMLVWVKRSSATVLPIPMPPTDESPLFHIVSAAQTLIPNSDGALMGDSCETGLVYSLPEKIPIDVRE